MAEDTKEVVQQRKRRAHDTRSTNSIEAEPAVKKECIQPDNTTSEDTSGIINTSKEAEKDDSKSVQTKVFNETYLAKKAKQKAAMERPKIFVTRKNVGMNMSATSTSDSSQKANPARLSIIELQTLLVFALRRGRFCKVPGWCSMKRPGKMSSLVLIVLGDVSATDFKENPDSFPFLSETFKENLRVRLVSPSSYFSSFDVDMYAVPQTKQRLQEFVKNNGQTSQRNGKKVMFPMEANFRLPADMKECTRYAWNSSGVTNSSQTSDTQKDADTEVAKDQNGAQAKVISPVQLLLSPSQMMDEKYPLPSDEDKEFRYLGFVNSKEQYTPVTKDSPLFALDCEMCLTTKMQHELTRVSVLNEKNEVLYDELVKPYNGIINYLTRYSGITKKMLDPVTKRLENVQREISDLLPPDAILCGQSLGNDLNALKMFHPYVIDTSVIFNLSGNRRIKCGLKRLSLHFLGKAIQDSKAGHCSSEDASATMDLVKFKLSKGLEFGDAVLGGITFPYMAPSATNKQQDNTAPASPKTSHQQTQPDPGKVSIMMRSLFDFLECRSVAACMIGQEKLVTKYQEEPGLKCVLADSDRQACKEARKAVHDFKFTWVEYAEFAELLESKDVAAETKDLSAERQKDVFRNLDKHVKKLVKRLPDKCLVSVVMPGRLAASKEHLEAAAFFHIT